LVIVLHDVAAGAVRRALNTKLPAPTDPHYRMGVHRLADRVVEAALGAAGIAATRVLFVKDKKVWSVDADGANLRMVSSEAHEALSPTWAPDGRAFAYMEFTAGKGQLFLEDVASARRAISRPRSRPTGKPWRSVARRRKAPTSTPLIIATSAVSSA
jgi:TolB protein